jgi:hypothetical protein
MSNIVYYSTNTKFANKIAEEFFNDVHYIWCAPKYDCESNPPSSNPKELYRRLFEEVKKGDKHSSKIRENKAGLRKAALYKFQKKIITKDQYDEILAMIHNATIDLFEPLLYIIPTEFIKNDITKPSSKNKSNLFSQEFIVENLERKYFDIITKL